MPKELLARPECIEAIAAANFLVDEMEITLGVQNEIAYSAETEKGEQK